MSEAGRSHPHNKSRCKKGEFECIEMSIVLRSLFLPPGVMEFPPFVVKNVDKNEQFKGAREDGGKKIRKRK